MTKKKTWMFILAGVFVGIAISVLSIQTTSATSQSSFCINCHDVPEFTENRLGTAHVTLECYDCHSDGLLKDKINGAGHLLSSVTGKKDANAYHEYKAEVSNDTCLTCHELDAGNRDRYIKARHDSFIRKEFSCTRCHDSEFFHGELGDLTSK